MAPPRDVGSSRKEGKAMNETPSGSQTPSSGDAPKPLGSPLAYLGAHYTTPDDLTLHKQISADLARFATLPEESSDV